MNEPPAGILVVVHRVSGGPREVAGMKGDQTERGEQDDDRQERVEGREQPHGAAEIEFSKRDRPVPGELAQEDAGYQVPRDHEEYANAEIAEIAEPNLQ